MAKKKEMIGSKKLWTSVRKMYPNIDEVLEDVSEKIQAAMDAQDALDEEYPVPGYCWDTDPDEYGKPGGCPFILISEEEIMEGEAELMQSLSEMENCASRKHQFQNISPLGKPTIKWCRFCGAVLLPDGRLFSPEISPFSSAGAGEMFLKHIRGIKS